MSPTPAEPVKENETTTPAPAEPVVPVSETTDDEPKSGEKKEGKDAKPTKSPARIARRLSARVGEFFKVQQSGKRQEVPAKVEEAPPVLEEPTPVAPLENPAADPTPATGKEQPVEVKETNEPPKIIETTPAPVAATA